MAPCTSKDISCEVGIEAWQPEREPGGPEPCVSWSSARPITVTATIDGSTYSGTGTTGNLPFQLNILQLFDIDYKIVVQPAASWVDCNYTYSLNFVIP